MSAGQHLAAMLLNASDQGVHDGFRASHGIVDCGGSTVALLHTGAGVGLIQAGWQWTGLVLKCTAAAALPSALLGVAHATAAALPPLRSARTPASNRQQLTISMKAISAQMVSLASIPLQAGRINESLYSAAQVPRTAAVPKFAVRRLETKPSCWRQVCYQCRQCLCNALHRCLT